jgi:hypothetical protein
MKKAIKIILFIVLPVIVAAIIITLIALPYGLKKYINEHGNEYTGRKIAVQEIKINFFKSTFSILDFKLFEADGQSIFVSFDTLQIDLSPFPLLSSKLVVNQFHLVKPTVNIVRRDSIYNFDDIMAFLNSKPKAEPAAKPSEPIQYILKNISMEQGKLLFTDKTVDQTTNLHDLSFFIPSISFNQDELKDAGIKFHFDNGGSLEAKAGYMQKSGTYTVDFSLVKLDISPFLPYAKSYIKLNDLSGLLGGNFQVSGKVSNLDSILFKGEGSVADFTAVDQSNHKVLGAKLANVSFRDSYPMKYNFQFDDIKLTEPYLYVEMKDSTINLMNLMVETPEETVPFNYSYQINQFRIDNGLMDLRDNSYGEPFDYHLSEISMKVDSFSSASKWVNAYSTMRLNKKGKLKAELGINPSDPYELKVDYVITNFQLSDLNIYSRHFVGYPILLGNMYYQGKTVITGKKLTSENKLIVRNAQLGKKSGGLMNLPLKLALYLLKDIHGDITLDLPLTGDLNNPQTKISKLIWQVLKNVVVKVVASPFIALSGLLGVQPAEVKGIEFNYADTTLTATHLRRLKLYTDLEKKKPDMKVEITGYNDVMLERKEIALAEAGKLYQTATGGDYSKDNSKFKAFLAEKLKKDTVNAGSGSLSLIGEHKVDSLQQSYSQLRIRKIEAALKSMEPSTNIKIVIPNKEVPENVGSRPVFELKYTVED